MNHIGQGPCRCNGEERHRQQQQVDAKHQQQICDPYAFTIEVRVCWIAVTVSYSNIHIEAADVNTLQKTRRNYLQTKQMILLLNAIKWLYLFELIHFISRNSPFLD